MLSAIVLSVAMLSVAMLSVVVLNVWAFYKRLSKIVSESKKNWQRKKEKIPYFYLSLNGSIKYQAGKPY
jgi:hypothetical protein